MLARLKNVKVRNDQRLRLYRLWVTQSIKFMLTVHDISTAARQNLEDTAIKFLKEWSGIGQSATVDYLYHPRGLGLPSFKTIYQQAHCSLELSCNFSTTDSLPPPSESNAVLIQPLVEQHQNGEISTTTMNRRLATVIAERGKNNRESRICTLVGQSKWLQLVKGMKEDTDWSEVLLNLLDGIVRFAYACRLGTASSFAKLKNWGRSSTDICPLCQKQGHLAHILSCCTVVLENHRYT